MKNSEIRELSVEELKEAIAAASLKLQKQEFAHAISPLDNPMQIRDTKKEVARLKTALHAHTLATVKGKIESGELTRFNAREFLRTENGKLPSPMDLGKIRKLIGQFEK